jgi:ADP-ribosylglycohydrolase
VLLGLAAGDRNGGPVELAGRLAESLAELGAFDARDAFRRHLAWHAEGAFDTGPVLVGALGGARWGARAIPSAALAHCQNLPRVERVAVRPASTWHGSPSGPAAGRLSR